jgi:urease accessory protein
VTLEKALPAGPHRQQRAAGRGAVAVGVHGGRTRLARLFQEGSAKVRVPRDGEGSGLEAVLINTSGGLTGGDKLAWKIDAGAGATLTLTTQACEKVYRSSQGEAHVAATISAGTGARVNWLPQETILFDGGRLERRLEADLADGATLLALEAVILGRRARGEIVDEGLFRDRWRIRRNGTLIHAEETCFQEPFEAYRGNAASLDGNSAFASVLLVDDNARDLLGEARNCIGQSGIAGGVSAWGVQASGKLLARIAARDGYELRKALVPLLRLLNRSAEGVSGLPRIWSI